MLKKVIIIIALIGAVIGAVLYLSGGFGDPWEEEEDEGQGARFAAYAIMKDGSEVPLSGEGFNLQTNSIKAGGQTISALKVIVQFRGSSPDYDEYRVLSNSQIQFRIGLYVPGSPPIYEWFSTNTITGNTLFDMPPRVLPFDNMWRNLPNGVSTYVDSEFNLIVPASFIQSEALAEGLAAPATLIFQVSYNIAWDVPEDPIFTIKTLTDKWNTPLGLVEGEAGLEGDIDIGNEPVP